MFENIKKVSFGDFLKGWNLRSNSVTRQVIIKTIINGKCQIRKCDILGDFSTTCFSFISSPRRGNNSGFQLSKYLNIIMLDLRFCGPKLSLCCMVLSCWGIGNVQFYCIVFENHRKSLIQHCELLELRLHFEWTNVH